jgi:type II secretory pathway component PulL
MSSARKRKDGYSHTSFAVRLVAMVLVVLFLLPLLSQVVEFAGAIDQDTIDQLKEQQTQTTETLNEYQSKLSALNDQKDSAVARYETLNQELEYLATQI